VGDFGPEFRGVPLGADPSCWGCKERTSQYYIGLFERPRLTNGEIIFEEFQPM